MNGWRTGIVAWGFALGLAACGGGTSAGDPGQDATVPDVPDAAADTPVGPDVPEDVPGDAAADTPPVDPCAGNTSFEVGAGVYDVTGPAADMGMMGYVVMDQKTAGIQMRLRARAFVVRSACNDARVAMVIVDIQGMFDAVHDEVVRRLADAYPGVYGADNVLLAATHTHSGPGGLSKYGLYQFAPVGGFDAEHFEAVVDGIVKAVGRAHDGMRPGRIRFAQADLPDTNRNRSPEAFAQDPEEERAQFPHQVDTKDTILRLEAEDGTPVGAIDFFGVHVTTVGAINKLITPDNKGYAAYRFDHAMGNDYSTATGFVSGFFNTTAGDSSPNVDGFSFDDKDGERDFQDMKASAGKMVDSARALFDGASDDLVGGVAAVKRYVQFDAVTVRPEYADGQERTTCKAATGLSMLAGGRLDWPGTGAPFQTCETTGGDLCSDCQGEKPTMVPVGDSDPPLGPDILPFQVVRIGNFAFVAAPFEITTVAGLRLRRAIGATLQPAGVDRVLVLGYANHYSGYMATREEYAIQDYEGACTEFGPWQLAASTQILDGLAAAIRDGTTPPAGPSPRVVDVVPMGPLNAKDAVPDGVAFGQVAQDVAGPVDRGTVARAVFWSAHPSNDYRIGDTFLAVERKDGDAWVRVADDGAFETRMKWGRPDGCSVAGTPCSQATILWDVPADATPGTYRLKHFASSKAADGTLTPFEGTSGEFEVR